jgi:hypothetical protein
MVKPELPPIINQISRWENQESRDTDGEPAHVSGYPTSGTVQLLAVEFSTFYRE